VEFCDCSASFLTSSATTANPRPCSLVRYFAAFNLSLFKGVYFPLSTLTVTDFYRGLARSLGEEPAFRNVDLFVQIQTAILTLFQNKRITPAIVLIKT
jgi:hypothetical protein